MCLWMSMFRCIAPLHLPRIVNMVASAIALQVLVVLGGGAVLLSRIGLRSGEEELEVVLTPWNPYVYFRLFFFLVEYWCRRWLAPSPTIRHGDGGFHSPP